MNGTECDEPVHMLIRWRIASNVVLVALLVYLILFRYQIDIVCAAGLILYTAIRLIDSRRFRSAQRESSRPPS